MTRCAWRNSRRTGWGLVTSNLVMVSSTGIIGRPLPMERIEEGIGAVQISSTGGHDFARGIMTTDTRAKTVAVEFEAGGKVIRLGGSTKGVGMIYPNMATMLCYLTTDAAVDPTFLAEAMRGAVNDSFNMVCVDGDMSTNDSAFIFANGRAGNDPLNVGTDGAGDVRHRSPLCDPVPGPGNGARRRGRN